MTLTYVLAWDLSLLFSHGSGAKNIEDDFEILELRQMEVTNPRLGHSSRTGLKFLLDQPQLGEELVKINKEKGKEEIKKKKEKKPSQGSRAPACPPSE